MAMFNGGFAAEPPSASEILQELRAFRECGSVLYIAAHPDDENTQFIAYLAKERGVRVGYLSLTRGEGGQNLIGPEIGDPLGVIRTQELLAARRIDGGEQFFTRARDFGFSKDYEQTLKKWDRKEVLSDVVHVIREFKPDVIVTRFPPEGGGTHGHHTASTVLALEAFKLAGDGSNFPGELGGMSTSEFDALGAWQPKRIFWNAFRGSEGRPVLKLDIGGFSPLLGKSMGEISGLSRSSHRSQGYGSVGSRGSRLDEFAPLDGLPPGKDLFDGVDTSWGRWPDLADVGTAIDGIIAHFEPLNPSASVPALLDLHRRVNLASHHGVRGLDVKRRQLDRLLQDCLGLYVETTVAQAEAVPGERINLDRTVVLRSNFPVRWVENLQGDGNLEVELHENQPMVRESDYSLPPTTPLSQPQWLREDPTPGMYRAANGFLATKPEDPFGYSFPYYFKVGGQALTINNAVPVQITADPAKGEVRRRLEVIAPVSLTPGGEVQLFAPGSERTVEVEVRAYRENQRGTVQLDAPAGWKVLPESQPFQLAAVGDHARVVFTVTAPAKAETASLTARATIDGKTYSTARQEIRYEHIPLQILQPPARVKAVCLDLAIRGRRVGYLPGAGDRTAESLAAMGYEVAALSGADLTPGRLKDFDAVVVGVRAFNVRTDLAPGLPALFAYAEGGGNVVVQYNTPNDLRIPRLAPFDLTLSRDLPRHRVTNENAPVTLLAPEHPALNAPNKITPADFDGWVQERGLNFPDAWDAAHWTALLACGDPGEAPLTSGLLVADCGKGHFVYTGLSFFRQLPAGVPGAYRLFANLVSLGK